MRARSVLALTVSTIDYLALHTVWFMILPARRTFRRGDRQDAIVPLGSVAPPDTSGGGPVSVSANGLDIHIDPSRESIRLRARTADLRADVTLTRPRATNPWASSSRGVTPGSSTRSRRTPCPRPGRSFAHGQEYRFDPADSFRVLDHGRGRWPYSTTWNWGSGSSTAGGRRWACSSAASGPTAPA